MDIHLHLGDFAVTAVSFGGQITSIRKGDLEYLWQADPAWWKGQAPILFPIVGCLRDGRAMTACGPTEMPRHGIIRRTEHKVLQASDTAVTFEISPNEAMKQAFPYDFTLRMSYALKSPCTLETHFTVINSGTETLLFTLGGHPAFNVPIDPSNGEDFADYELHFTKAMTCSCPMMNGNGLYDMERTMPLLQNESVLKLSHEVLSRDVLTFHDVPDSTATLKGSRSGRGVKLTFPGFEYLGVWSAANAAPFVAVEPWVGCSTCSDEDDVFEHKRGIVELPKGETFERAFTIEVF